MEKLTLRGTVADIIYYNDDNGYTVFDFESTDGEEFTATGYTVNLAEGEEVELTGNWTFHSEYGEQFKIEYYTTVLPSKEKDILRYLSSGVVYGVRAATAKKIVQEFGEDTFEVMLNYPERLSEIKGISINRAMKIAESFKEIKSMQSIVMFLQRYNVSSGMAVKIYKSFGGDAVDQIRKNPYILTDIDGIKFSVSDKIAFGEGIAKNSPIRIKAGIKYLLSQAAYTSGHVYLPRQLMIEHGAYSLQVDEADIEDFLKELSMSKDVYAEEINGETVYYLSSVHTAESYCASKLHFLAISDQKELLSPLEAEQRIEEYEDITGMKLASQQKNAIITSLGGSGCMVLTGGPGTGKTTTINTILRFYEDHKLKVALAAPTGRAAKRMTQVTGMDAKTIHRLLGANGEGGITRFTHDETNPIEADVIIVDEVSMIDVLLMYALLKAVKPNTRLILSGDADQLPSVGPGNVLNDIISSGVIPVIKLNKIFRQAEESLIVVNAHNINKGEMPELDCKTNDFFFMKRNSSEEVVHTICDLCDSRLAIAYGINSLTDIQVISPSKKGICGTVNLNLQLQKVLNPPHTTKNEYVYGKTTFRVGDKVMQTKNNYELYYTRQSNDSGVGIFNGDMGIITDISVTDKYMVVVFDEDKRCEYPFNQLEELDLAYAITVHKSQGSEFPYVIMPATNFPPMLMCRNLFYTAVTRAKTMVILVGNEQSIEYMTKNISERQRFTALTERLLGSEKDIFSQ